MVIVGAMPLNTVPLESVPLMVPIPVTVKVRFALPPLQIAVVPLMAPVGRAFTVNAEDALLVKGEPLYEGDEEPIETL